MVRLFVIDDKFLMIEGWRNIYNSENTRIKVVGSSFSVIQAIPELQSLHNVGIIILNLFLKDSDPISNIKMLNKTFPSIPIIIISLETAYEWQVEMFRNGACAYLNKADTKESFTNIILQVAQGYKVIPTAIDRLLKFQNNHIKIGTTSIRENDIISDLKNGLTVKEIAAKNQLSVSSTEKMLHNFRHLLGVKTNCEMLYRLMKKSTG